MARVYTKPLSGAIHAYRYTARLIRINGADAPSTPGYEEDLQVIENALEQAGRRDVVLALRRDREVRDVPLPQRTRTQQERLNRARRALEKARTELLALEADRG